MISATIDAYEGRDVATAHVPQAFMNADQDEEVFLRCLKRPFMAL